MKERVLMVGPYPPQQVGGGEFQLKTLSEMFIKKGHRVTVLSMNDKKNYEIVYENGVKIYRIGKFVKYRRGKMKIFQALKYMTIEIFNPILFLFTIFLILKERIKTVHIITYNQFSFSPLLASKMLMRNVIVTMHTQELLCSHSTIMPSCLGIRRGRCGECMSIDHGFLGYMNTLRGFAQSFSNLITKSIIFLKIKMTNNLANRIVFPSDHLKKLHIKYGVKEKKVRVIPCFLDESESRKDIAEELKEKFKRRGKKIILYVGKIMEEKGIKVLISSLPFVLKKNKKWQLLVVGDGISFKKMKNLTKRLNLDKNVELVGGVPHKQVFSYYKIADLVVIPSIVPETFSIALSEASLSKKIIICSKIGTLQERIVNGKNGLLVKPNDPKDLANKILYVLNNHKKLGYLGETAYMNQIQKYSSEKSFSEYLNLIKGD